MRKRGVGGKEREYLMKGILDTKKAPRENNIAPFKKRERGKESCYYSN